MNQYLIELQTRYRVAMAAGKLEEMSKLADQIQHLRTAQMRRRSTQSMCAVVLGK